MNHSHEKIKNTFKGVKSAIIHTHFSGAKDIHETPISNFYPGGFINVEILNNLYTNNFIKYINYQSIYVSRTC